MTQLPSNMDAERAVLGAVIMDNAVYETVAARLNHDDFSSDSHRKIYQAMQRCHGEGQPIDFLSIKDRINGGSVESIGGIAYLSGLTQYWGTCEMVRSSNVGSYIETVRRTAILRRCAVDSNAIMESACAPSANPTDIKQRLERLLAAVDAATSTTGRSVDHLFIPGSQFIATIPDHVDWLVEGVIQRGANGFFCANPKAGKSWAAADMALSLALGCDWIDFRVPNPTKVALISREDAPGLTAWRITQLLRSKANSFNDSVVPMLHENLYVNTRQQSSELMLDKDEHISDLVTAMTRRRIEFAIFDVFNVLHGADENDNQEMREVLRQLSNIQKEVGCGIGVVHHFNKAGDGSMTQRLRGSSAIAGWAEWLIGISMADEETKVRRMEFELKASQPPSPIYYHIDSDGKSAELVRCEAPQAGTNQATRTKYMQ